MILRSRSPHFARFMQENKNSTMGALLAQRTSQVPASMRDPDTIGEIVQFLSLLMAFEGVEAISADNKKALLPKLKAWSRNHPGRTASNASERCLGFLSGDRLVCIRICAWTELS